MDVLNQLGVRDLEISIVGNNQLDNYNYNNNNNNESEDDLSPIPTLSPKKGNNYKKTKSGSKLSNCKEETTRQVILNVDLENERQTYIGWDIGIKNLAYCIISIISDPSDYRPNEDIRFEDVIFRIKDWNIINLIDNINNEVTTNKGIYLTNRPKIVCDCSKINGKGYCYKKATYCQLQKRDGKYQGMCVAHFKRLGTQARLPTTDNKPKCFFPECTKNAAWVDARHHYLGYCSIHKNKIIKDLEKENKVIIKENKVVIKENKESKENKEDKENKEAEQDQILKIIPKFIRILKKKSATGTNLTTLGHQMYQKLDQIPHLLDVNTVLLENQPVLKNPTMKSVQMLLYSYFIMKGIHQPENLNIDSVNSIEPIDHIQCYNASKKTELALYLNDRKQKEIDEATSKVKGQYAKNKKTAVLITKDLLIGKGKWETLFTNSKKKDDLCDALLMTLRYLIK